MCKAQNKNMERKRKQGNTTPQKANNNNNRFDDKGREWIPVADLRRIMIQLFNEIGEELNENMQKTI
jgi:hypothetical protein